ncbi:Hypothetical predicted protein [Mytilus galloprovincialis]|uniref:Integrase catalytic domain-containing protein n=1 Tax=Mytilus galloprovincialis TaxID=29158 RepID=A0A8B6BSH1_MYTGA|nr:Hypothetical predicted protein [Mytilus galloprovincialis]
MGKIIPDYVQSCHFCQIRKVSNKNTKQEIVSIPTPAEPFQVWQMDLCGPYPVSANGNIYVLTAADMFTKLLFAYPLRNKDAITVFINIPSSHLIKLRDPTGKRKLSDAVHINRLKIAHIRAPDPAHCLAPLHVESNESEEKATLSSDKNDDIEKQPSDTIDSEHPVRRSTRKVNKPMRFRDENFVTSNYIESSTDAKSEKVKRILAKKRNGNQSCLYLVQLVGEPSQNAQRRTLSQLSQKAQDLLISRPPTLVK